MPLTIMKLLASFLAFVFSIFNISADIPGFSDSKESTTSIQYLNDEKGSMDAIITINTTTDGNYKLYWADENNNMLTFALNDKELPFSEFAIVTTYYGEGSVDLPDYTAIPDGAENILVTLDGETLEILEIPEEKIADREDKIYSYGALSDLHFNRYFNGNGEDIANMTFTVALDFFDDADVSLVAMSGDIAYDGELESFMMFNEISSQYDFPVYTSTGNHDIRKEYKKENWLAYMNPGAYGENRSEDVINVADNGMDFVYQEPVSGDIFVFLCQTSNNYGIPYNSLLQPSQLNWLEEQLNAHKDKSVYIFFHTMLGSTNENPFITTGNVMNNLGWAYPLIYTPGANDEIRLRNILRENKNATFFNGHSHWAYHMQCLNPELNISKNGEDGATYVHISSVSCPRTTGDYQILWSSNDSVMSEGYLIEVYEDTMVLYGVDFTNGRILAYATYESAK
ncbi:MAG: metallophosphoesterase [Clostridia bacterium]|nr:metallophosphoesterase [Clostridia bacterium]